MDIDAIIAWVDGSDPAHRARRAGFSDDSAAGAASDARFAESGEIYLCLASILKYAPWIRRIVIVTDGQRPALLDVFARDGHCAPGRIEVIDHDVIFAGTGAVRPSFNIRAIEAALHRIPDLAAHFVYFNDDMLLTAPVTQATFFRDGAPVLHGRWASPRSNRPLKRAEAVLRRVLRRTDTRPGHGRAQDLAARIAGHSDRFLRAPHAPHPVRTATAAAFERDNPESFARQLSHRFRDRRQYNPIALANHLELAAGTPDAGPLDIAYIRPGPLPQIREALDRIEDDSVWAACLQSLERLHPEARQLVLAALTARLASHLPAETASALGRVD